MKRKRLSTHLSKDQISGDYCTCRFEKGQREDTLILNMGPQHPSTHGVLRIILELDGEYILRAEPVLGYLHRMHEAMAENRTYLQYLPIYKTLVTDNIILRKRCEQVGENCPWRCAVATG